MKARSLGVVLIVCMNALACFRSVDATKVRCTTSEHCPSNFVCSAGWCVSRSVDAPPAGSVDTGVVAAVDSSPVDTMTVAVDAAEARSDGGSPTLDASSTDLPDDMSWVDATDVPLPGTGGSIGTGGGLGSGGSGGGAGGVPGSGGVVVTGGAASGGVIGTGGIVVTGGVVGSGGTTGTGGITCQTKSRDCTSSLDNDCNGTPDNQETTYCTCVVGNPQACQEHPGYDGKGICKAGTQTCAASGDKTTSSWGPCSGSVGPSTRNCTTSADNDCNGTADSLETAYCQCPSGQTQSCLPAGMCTAGSQTCATSSDKATTAWGACTGYTGPTTLYRDVDGDGYGNPSQPAQVCPGTLGYVSNAEDCDDADATFKPGVSLCTGNFSQKKTCVSGTNIVVQGCAQGCLNGICRDDGTIGLPGWVTCGPFAPRCTAADGCYSVDGRCSTASDLGSRVQCDGPNDCGSGESCCASNIYGGVWARCIAGACAGVPSNEYQVCDPKDPSCGNCAATTLNDGLVMYTCP